MNLKMQATDEKVTLGLAEPVLGGNEQAKEIFGFLQSKTFSKDREGYIMGDVFADGVVRNGGFTEFAEKVNGRVAQIAFPIGLTETFNGDLLEQLAAHPIKVVIYSILPTRNTKIFVDGANHFFLWWCISCYFHSHTSHWILLSRVPWVQRIEPELPLSSEAAGGIQEDAHNALCPRLRCCAPCALRFAPLTYQRVDTFATTSPDGHEALFCLTFAQGCSCAARMQRVDEERRLACAETEALCLFFSTGHCPLGPHPLRLPPSPVRFA
jgi:hypothetical protein